MGSLDMEVVLNDGIEVCSKLTIQFAQLLSGKAAETLKGTENCSVSNSIRSVDMLSSLLTVLRKKDTVTGSPSLTSRKGLGDSSLKWHECNVGQIAVGISSYIQGADVR